MNSIIYVGMDVHKNTYSLCAVSDATGEILAETKILADSDLITKFIENARDLSGNPEAQVKTGYEAGCLGYSLYWELAARGIECVILAPSTMQKPAKNKVLKNDRRDARNIATNLANNSYKSVYVPDHEDVKTKEYIRMMGCFKTQLKRIKQQINAFLLRLGLRYPGNSRWIPAHLKWMNGLELEPEFREILDEYLSEYDSLSERIERFKGRLEEMAQKERYKEKVEQLRCLKGIDTASAMTIHVETSDFSRFPNAAAYSSYCGLTPAENSSGEKNNRLNITKMGNSMIRKTLIEAAQVLVRGTIGKKGKKVKAKQKGQDVKVIDYADKAVERLQKKYHHMIYRNVNRNIVITAIARELACFIWGIETGHIS